MLMFAFYHLLTYHACDFPFPHERKRKSDTLDKGIEKMKGVNFRMRICFLIFARLKSYCVSEE
jgi:hypothetical protein